jgi:hypothetical protein
MCCTVVTLRARAQSESGAASARVSGTSAAPGGGTQRGSKRRARRRRFEAPPGDGAPPQSAQGRSTPSGLAPDGAVQSAVT